MEYDDLGDSFAFDFNPNEIPIGSKSKGKLSSRSYSIQFERKWKSIFLSDIVHILFFFSKYVQTVKYSSATKMSLMKTILESGLDMIPFTTLSKYNNMLS